MKYLLSLFKRKSADQIRSELLSEALCAGEEHRAAAEHHTALADMYFARAKRIEPMSLMKEVVKPQRNGPVSLTRLTVREGAKS